MPFRLLDPSTAAAATPTVAGAPLTSVGETLASLRAELLLQLSSRSDVDTTRLNRWINWGYRNLCAMLTLAELRSAMTINTVANQPFYLLPIQVRSIKTVAIRTSKIATGGVELLMMSDEEYMREPDLPLSVSVSWPTGFFRYGLIHEMSTH
jgi:hypothetical protein